MKLQEGMSKKNETLNCHPDENSAALVREKRIECNYTDLSQIFRQEVKDFTKQFAHIYAVRLTCMKELIKRRAVQKWGKGVKILKLLDLHEAKRDKCVVIGTLFLDQRLKPSILKEISEEAQLVPQPVRTHFVSDIDTLILEDELQRIVLHGGLDVHKVVTGVVCGVLGQEDTDGGKFHVEDCCWAYADYVPSLISPPDSDQFLVFVSGLALASNANLLQIQLLVEWLSGMLGEPDDQLRVARIVRVIVAGNSIRSSVEKKEDRVSKTTTVENSNTSLSAVKLFDSFLHQLVQYIDVDVMPGEFDPTNHTLPQQPMHFCMFPQASRFESLHGVPNPYSCLVNGRRVTGTSGQPIEDIARYSELTDAADILQQTLEWGHLSPTSPDTLPCYPFYKRDPFILETLPDIFFAGNQDRFQTRSVDVPSTDGSVVTQVRLVCVPRYDKTSTCAIVNLSSLDCYPMSFTAGLK